MPARDVAFAIVAFYLGAEMLTHLDGDRTRTQDLFDAAARTLPLIEPLLGPFARENGDAREDTGPSTC